MIKTRRDFIKTMSLGLASLSIPNLFFSCISTKRKPNIIFIMSDDHAEKAISCYSKKLIDTPNIDRIANEGIIFKNSFVTNSICAPSRAVLLTGKYSHMNGLRDNRDEFDGTQLTFPKLLQQNGYETNIVGKWHLKTEPTGFDDWKILVGQGQYYNPVFIENGVEVQYLGYTTTLITDKAIDMMEQRDQKRPFCMLVHHKAPHRNWMPDSKHMDVFNDKDLPLPETLHDDYSNRSAAAHADMRIKDMYLSLDMKLKKESYQKETGTGGNANFTVNVEKSWQNTYENLTDKQKEAWDKHYNLMNEKFTQANFSDKELLEWKYQRYIKDYLRCILSLDENIGRLLDYLDENGLADDTIVIYTSDQGFYLGEHGWYDKRFMYEESLSMPLVMRYPREIEPGQISDDIVLNLDFAPTFLDFAETDIPEEMQGKSFRSITQGKTPENWRTSMYYHYYEYPHGWHNVKRHYGIRTQSYKLIHFYDEVEKWELYDLDVDINEMNNLYNDSTYSNIVKSLKAELKQLQLYYGDKLEDNM